MVEAQTNKNDEFWHLVLPAKLLDIGEAKQPKFDAVIVDEGQDFKPEWYEYLQTLLKSGTESHFSVFLDEHQDIFGHWKHFPCSRHLLKGSDEKLSKHKIIVDYLNQAYPTKMAYFEKSPIGVPVVERAVQNDARNRHRLCGTSDTSLGTNK